MKRRKLELRPIEINGHPYVGNKSGFFHRWCIEPLYDEEMRNTRTMALIELNDGRIKLIEPEYVKFTKPYPAIED